MAKQEGVTEQLKVRDQMLWVRRKNNIRASTASYNRIRARYVFSSIREY
ncbi:MAG: TnpV protein [Lachnospiraceae bacterium]|nr:TnpV protein [Lachnospiraceae bacterium]